MPPFKTETVEEATSVEPSGENTKPVPGILRVESPPSPKLVLASEAVVAPVPPEVMAAVEEAAKLPSPLIKESPMVEVGVMVLVPLKAAN